MKIFKLLLFILLLIHTHLYAQNGSLEKVTLQLQWKHQFEFAGFYAAKEKGFYKDAGLDVSFVEFDERKNIVNEVVKGKVQYGVSYSSILADYLNGKDLLLLANFLKQSPLVLVAQENIKTLSDLKGKRVMGLDDSIHNITLLSMLDKFGIKASDLKPVPASFNLDDFIDKKIDAMSVFTTNELYILNKKGIKYTLFDPVVYGSKYYDVNLFTSKKEYADHPKRVQDFRNASIKGWEYALKHKEEIVTLILKKYNTQNKSKEALLFEAKQIEQLMLPNVYKVGSIDPDRIKLIAESFMQLSLIDPALNRDITAFIYGYQDNPLGLTAKELAFIQNHPKIVLGTDKSWKPYVISNSDGSVSGYDADILALINKASGANFVLRTGEWADMQKKMQTKEIDGLSTGSIQEKRKKYLNFSDIYIAMQKMVITSKENPKNIRSLKDLEGKTIAIHRSNAVDKKVVQRFPRSKVLRFDSVAEVINAVITGNADVLFGNGAIFYLANELGMPYLKRSANLNETLELAFGIRKDWPEAISIINKSLAYVGKYKLLEAKKKWFGSKEASISMDIYKNTKPFGNKEILILSDTEKHFLKEKKEISMCVDPSWMPYEMIEYGKHVGISADYIQYIASLLHTPFTLVPTKTWSESLALFKDGKCDVLSLVAKTPTRTTFMDFTKPYITSPLVIATDNDKSFISDLSELKDKKIGIVRNYASMELLQKKYLNINFIAVNTVAEGLEQLSKGKLHGFIDSLTTLSYYIQQRYSSQLKISGKLNEKLVLSIATQKNQSQLLNILNKALNNVLADTKQHIFNQWVTVKFDHTDYGSKVFWKIVTPILLLIILLIISHYVLRQYNKRLKKQVHLNIEALREQDEILLQKYRMAAMGEMLSMIAHQWRQPLSAINSAIMGIDIKIESGQFDLDKPIERQKFLIYLKRKHNSITDYVQYLSTTTDDFRNFFNPNKNKENIPLTLPIESSLKIVESSMKKNGIDIVKNFEVDTEVTMFHNEIMQVILNLFKNSEYNFIDKDVSHPVITISTFFRQKKNVIRICDNGGGIPKEVVKKVFEPYYSTKDEKNGTGLGLYMSKIMIEQHHNAQLKMINSKEGVCFELIFKS